MGSKGGLVFALVVFVFLWVMSTILAIMFYSNLEQAKKEADDAVQTRMQYAKDADVASEEVRSVVQESGNRSAIRHLMAKNRSLKVMLSEETDSIEQIQEKLENAGVEEGVSAINRIEDLKSQLAKQAKDINELGAKLEAATETYEGRVADFVKARESLNNELREREQLLAQLESKIRSLDENYEQKFDTAETQIRSIASSANEQLETKDVRIQELNAKIDELEELLEIAQAGPGGPGVPEPPDGTTDIDAVILSVTSDQSTCYINKGKGDQLVLGLTFRVYDPTLGIVTRGTGVNKEYTEGKAIIEVIRIAENTAECRIIERFDNQPVLGGDVVANIVYDPNRKFKFFVFGDFDLDYDGRADDTGQDQIEGLIRRFGGRVTDRLTVDTDYVIVGNEPELPGLGVDVEADPTLRGEVERAREKWQAWQKVVGEATRLGIPVLNQNRFLNLVGFYSN